MLACNINSRWIVSAHSGELCARYGTYKLVQKMPGGEKLVGFTRILHRSKNDILVDEVSPLGALYPPHKFVQGLPCQTLSKLALVGTRWGGAAADRYRLGGRTR